MITRKGYALDFDCFHGFDRKHYVLHAFALALFCFYNVVERSFGNTCRNSVPSAPLPHITRRYPEIRRGNLRFPLFPQCFSTCAFAEDWDRVVHSGPRSAPLDLLGSGFSQKPLFLQRFRTVFGKPFLFVFASAWIFYDLLWILLVFTRFPSIPAGRSAALSVDSPFARECFA